MRAGTGILLLVLVLAVPAPSRSETHSDDVYARGVLGLQVTYQMWDQDRPWAKKTPESRSAGAVLIDQAHILTTAQMVDHATLIQLATFGRTGLLEPRIVRVDRDVDLALLAVDDPEALEDLGPVALAERTPTSGTLQTVRWRRQQLELAASRVTRFEVGRGWGGRVEHAFLRMRTDMAGGGWAEPVFDDGKLVGITVSQAEQKVRAIPIEVVRAFLSRALGPDPYVGFPALGVLWQTNRDTAVSRFVGQEGGANGVLVRQVPWGSSGCGVLEPMDLLLELDGQAIDAEGYYLHPHLGRLQFDHHLVEHHRPGDMVPVRVFRDGREQELDITLRGYPAGLDLTPLHHEGQPPYVVAGGLVFRELDRPYLSTWGKQWDEQAPLSLRTRYDLDRGAQTPERRRIVLLKGVLPSAYNVGYQNLQDEVVERINGRPIDGVPDVVEAFDAPLDGFHVIDLAPDAVRGQVVLDAASLDAATAEILEEYGVPAAMVLPGEPLPEGGGVCPGDY